ncbi:intradiol ring-cleavage dioxygenase [Massilia putida]|uniref:intradiol ring-cleavage dioxygenase n=1 Tax=Massilia putida TaxID=1141883 RepID=UPI000952C968|nr:intradiol ring-cleavage dioxygenase [Massilia putida]
MNGVTADNITEVVNERLERCTNPRLKQLLTSLTRHLHDFAREVKLTEPELMDAIAFLTETGQKCDEHRQEFILLSDVLGMTMLTVALGQQDREGATEASVLGPFYVQDAAPHDHGEDLAHGASGVPCFVEGRIRGENGTPLAGAVVDVWHCDDAGFYDVQYAGGSSACRGRLHADDEGRFHYRTVRPVAYPIPTDGPVGRLLSATGRHPWRPAHMHFLVQAPGHATLVTQVFDKFDPYIDSDAVFGVRPSLIGEFVPHESEEFYRGEKIGEPFYTLSVDLVLSADHQKR